MNNHEIDSADGAALRYRFLLARTTGGDGTMFTVVPVESPKICI